MIRFLTQHGTQLIREQNGKIVNDCLIVNDLTDILEHTEMITLFHIFSYPFNYHKVRVQLCNKMSRCGSTHYMHCVHTKHHIKLKEVHHYVEAEYKDKIKRYKCWLFRKIQLHLTKIEMRDSFTEKSIIS